MFKHVCGNLKAQLYWSENENSPWSPSLLKATQSNHITRETMNPFQAMSLSLSLLYNWTLNLLLMSPPRDNEVHTLVHNTFISTRSREIKCAIFSTGGYSNQIHKMHSNYHPYPVDVLFTGSYDDERNSTLGGITYEKNWFQTLKWPCVLLV